jgi:hypothetical protein
MRIQKSPGDDRPPGSLEVEKMRPCLDFCRPYRDFLIDLRWFPTVETVGYSLSSLAGLRNQWAYTHRSQFWLGTFFVLPQIQSKTHHFCPGSAGFLSQNVLEHSNRVSCVLFGGHSLSRLPAGGRHFLSFVL